MYAYPRVSLAISFLFLGYVIIIKNNSFIYRIIGICIILLSFFFHRSMAIIILISIFSIYQNIFKNKILVILAYLISILSIYYIINYSFLNYVLVENIKQDYLQNERNVSSEFKLLLISMCLIIYMVNLFILINIKNINDIYKRIFFLGFNISLFSIIYGFINEFSSVIVYRTANLSIIPAVVVVSKYLYFNNYYNKLYIFWIFLFFVFNSFRLLITSSIIKF